jgi:hypothetical protein
MKGAFASILEVAQIPEGLEHCILNDVLRVRNVSNAARKATARPSIQRRNVSREQHFNRVFVAH